jgi:enterobactin synthetase component D
LKITSPFPDSVPFAAVHHDALDGRAPHPDELATLSARAVPKRRREFTVGRVAAQSALRQLLEGTPPPVLPGADRAPQWPTGVVGTISHSNGWGLAAVDHAALTGSLGLDLEHLSGVRRIEIARHVADDGERAWIGDDRRRLLALFSAKESIFKVFYPFRRCFFGFDAVTCAPVEGGFDVTLREAMSPAYPVGARVHVGVRWQSDFVLTWIRLPP